MNDFTNFLKDYAQYMDKTVDEVIKYIEKLRTETYNVLSYSYGKDSGACIYACELLGIPIHEIITADVWATDEIPADLPPMWNWKGKADSIIKERYGIDVKHVCAMTTKEKKYNPNFQMPLVSVGGGTNSHTKMEYTEQYNKNEQSNEIKNTNSTTSAIEQVDLNTSTDSHVDKNRGVTHTSKQTCLKDCKLTYQDLFYRISNGKIARGGVQRIPNAEVELLHRRTQKERVTTDFQYQSTEEIGVRHSKQRGFHKAPRSKVRI